MLVLAHNLAAQFTNRQLNITTNQKAKSSEKLSSGYRINRSADDAAGLSISEKMRKQVRGLNQASENVQAGISLCQVADGALGETTEILQRMRQLSVQAANGTNSESDRSAIQQEIDQLTKEVDRIAKTTNFNEEIKPLLGIAQTDSFRTPKYNVSLMEFTYTYIVDSGFDVVNGVTYNVGDAVTKRGLTISDLDRNVVYDGMGECYASIEMKEKVKNSIEYVTGNGFSCFDLSLSDLKVDNNGFVYFISKISGQNQYLLFDTKSKLSINQVDYLNEAGENAAGYSYIKSVQQETSNCNNKTIWIQAGADTGDGLTLSMVNATAKGLGIKEPDISVMSEANCDDAMNRLGDAIEKVSSYRSLFGAQQNRLECAKAIDDNTAENTTAAESRIRDTDMAEEMVGFSKNNILAQVGQSMLAQANQSTQGILSLLQ